MKYTYIVDISDIDKAWERIEKRTKREIKRCEEEIFLTTDVNWFNKLHKKTRPDRKIDEDFIETIFKKKKAIIYATQTAGSVISNDGKTGYYLFGARHKSMSDGCPSKILWQAMKDLNAKGVTSGFNPTCKLLVIPSESVKRLTQPTSLSKIGVYRVF